MGIAITGIGSYVPEQILTNADLEKMVDTSDEWIRSHVGIYERRICSPEQSSTDLMVPAAIQALESAGRSINEIDMILVATSWPDRHVELSSDILATKLGAPTDIPAIDTNAECASFTWGIASAVEMIENRRNNFRKVLLVSGDATTKFVDYTDRYSCILFGDCAGAVVLEEVADEENVIIGWRRESDRCYQDCLRVEAGGSAMPASHETVKKMLHAMHFGPAGGAPMLKAIVNRMPELCQEVCQEYGYDIRDLKRIIPHQVNMRITEAAKKRLRREFGISGDILFDANTAIYGNCSGSSVPLALDTVYRQGDLEPGDLVLLVAFGAGLKYGAVLLRWWLPKYAEKE